MCSNPSTKASGRRETMLCQNDRHRSLTTENHSQESDSAFSQCESGITAQTPLLRTISLISGFIISIRIAAAL
jgi:hypothetical protein